MVGQQQLISGFELAGRAIRAWGSPQFWKYIGWWHQETHYDIPFDREVREMEKALSECFNGVRPSLYGVVGTSCVSIGASEINFLPSGVKTAGSYHVTSLNMVLQSSRKPSLLHRFMLKSLLGIHWYDAKEKTQDEYTTRLLDELGRNG